MGDKLAHPVEAGSICVVDLVQILCRAHAWHKDSGRVKSCTVNPAGAVGHQYCSSQLSLGPESLDSRHLSPEQPEL